MITPEEAVNLIDKLLGNLQCEDNKEIFLRKAWRIAHEATGKCEWKMEHKDWWKK